MSDGPKHRRDVEPDAPAELARPEADEGDRPSVLDTDLFGVDEGLDVGPDLLEYAFYGGVRVPQGAAFDAALEEFISGDPEHPSRRSRDA